MGADGNLRRPQAPAAAVLILPHIRRFVKRNAENFSARSVELQYKLDREEKKERKK